MSRGFRVTTEFAFLLSGVLIIVMAWAANLIGIVTGEDPSGHGGSSLYLWLIVMFQGLAFSTVGVVFERHAELMANPILTKRYLVGYLFIMDGGLHLLALNQHLYDSLPAALFFAYISPVQILVGMFYPTLPRRFDLGWLLFTGFLIAAFVATRTLPVWPIGVIEDVDPLGVLSKLVEVLTILFLVSLLRASPTEAPIRAGLPVNGR